MRFKKIVLPFLFLVGIATAMAFTQPGKSNSSMSAKNKDAKTEYAYWFSYIGPSPATFSQLTNPNNYVLLPDDQNPEEQCEYGEEAVCLVLCERFWNGFGWKPDFAYNPSYGSAYWGLSNFYYYGSSSTGAVITKAL